MVAPEAFYFGMRNPELMYTGTETINDILNPSMPSITPLGHAYTIFSSFGK